MTDPIQEIQDKLEAAWALNEKDGFDQPDALICIQNLLKLVKAYEIIMDRSFVGTGEMMEVKKEIFGDL
jgi:hypothetical protein